jgi:hypothetical protein
MRYEHEHPGDLLHLDTKRLARIERPSHRVTGDRRHTVRGIGWEYLFVAVDDHARIGFTQMKPDERRASEVAFLRASVAYFAALGVSIRRILTDNGSAFRSKRFAAACRSWVLNIALPVPIGRRPTAKPSASSSRRCASGPMAFPTTIQSSGAPCSSVGTITTTGIARIKASAVSHPCRAQPIQK